MLPLGALREVGWTKSRPRVPSTPRILCVVVVDHGVMLVLSDADRNVWARGNGLDTSE